MTPGRIYLKDNSVRLWACVPELLEGLVAACHVYGQIGLPLIVTSGNDGHHRDGSKHYTGEAVDLRSHHIPRSQLDQTVRALKNVLGDDRWDVVLESRGEPNEHIHIEIDPH